MRKTNVVAVDGQRPEPAVIERAAGVIRAGGLVAFPTETVYGLGADALNETAVKKIFTAKERPSHDPIIVHIVDPADLERLAQNIPAIAYQLADAFWPGPLTLVLLRTAIVPDAITAGGPTVAVRCPAHPIARALIAAAGTPIGAPSANRFSRTSPTTAQHVLDDLNGRLELILDGGPTSVGVESTVVDLTGARPRVLRPGGVSIEALRAVLGAEGVDVAGSTIQNDAPERQPLTSPGLLERHYAPRTPLWLFDGSDEAVRAALQAVIIEAQAAGRRVVLLIAAEDRDFFELPADLAAVIETGSLSDLTGVARQLYGALRAADQAGGDVILARSYPAEGLGLALRDRLQRAAELVKKL